MTFQYLLLLVSPTVRLSLHWSGWSSGCHISLAFTEFQVH